MLPMLKIKESKTKPKLLDEKDWGKKMGENTKIRTGNDGESTESNWKNEKRPGLKIQPMFPLFGICI